MDRSRRRRQFNRELDDEKNYRDRFRFPLNLDDENNENERTDREDKKNVEEDEDTSFIRREQRKTLFEETKKTEKKNSSFRINKAREIPSAVHGTKKHSVSKEDEDSGNVEKTKSSPETSRVPSAIHGTNKQHLSEEELSYIEADKNEVQIENKGYISPIIESLKKERILRAKREQKRIEERKHREERERARYDDPYNLKGRQIEQQEQLENKTAIAEDEEMTAVSEEPKEKQPAETSSPYNVIMTPYDKKKQKNRHHNDEKRQGPKYTMPSIHMLGSDLTDEYEQADESLDGKVVAAFEAIGIPAEIYDYKSNGIIGRYEISLDRNFRLSNITRLKEYLVPNLPFGNFRIIAPIIGTSNIGIEFPLPEPIHIPFSKVFSSSSLKLRKNDFKFVVGKTVDDKIFSYELQKAGHMLVYGNNEIDSANAIDNILISMMMNHNPNEFRILIASDKSHYNEYKGLPHLFQEPKSIMDPDVLSGLFKELNDRHNQFRRAHVRNLNSYNQRVSYESRKSVIAVVIDDLSQLFESNNPDAVRTIVQVLKKGKPLGIHLIMKHTRPDVSIRFEWLQMMQTRISFKDEKSNIIEGSDTLIDGNDMLIQIPTSNKALRVNAAVLPELSKQRVFSHLKNIGG
ncbi:DNA translocase FtsK [Salinicoccus sp. HZC-1]|uniref:DNA translocase FtsK n=1 Tax=Salinicoccus sp. HZC-1 TaxID=3385497 RepID=UPI00398B1C8B